MRKRGAIEMKHMKRFVCIYLLHSSGGSGGCNGNCYSADGSPLTVRQFYAQLSSVSRLVIKLVTVS